MSRYILNESSVHPSIQEKISNSHRGLVEELIYATKNKPIVVIGMKHNINCRKACKALKKENLSHTYLEYGGYLNDWRKRNALKMWTGWPTFPMVFIKGQLIGGASDLKSLIEKGELAPLLK